MHYVYLLESLADPMKRYVGVTLDLKGRLAEHNAGKSTHTAKHMPWRIVTYIAFSGRSRAEAFERYLKSGSGHAFAGSNCGLDRHGAMVDRRRSTGRFQRLTGPGRTIGVS